MEQIVIESREPSYKHGAHLDNESSIDNKLLGSRADQAVLLDALDECLHGWEGLHRVGQVVDAMHGHDGGGCDFDGGGRVVAGKQGEVSQEPSFLSRKGSETMERCKLLPAAEPSIVRDAGAEGPLGLDQLLRQVVKSAEIAG